jgi:hypothetical protein
LANLQTELTLAGMPAPFQETKARLSRFFVFQQQLHFRAVSSAAHYPERHPFSRHSETDVGAEPRDPEFRLVGALSTRSTQQLHETITNAIRDCLALTREPIDTGSVSDTGKE